MSHDDDAYTTTAGTANSIRLKLVRGVFELKGIPLFEGLSAEDLLPIAEAATRVEVQAGDVLANEGDDAVEVWLVLEGSVQARRHGVVVAHYEGGDLPGDLALQDGKHPCGLIAATTTSLLALRRDDFEELLDLNPVLARNVMSRLAARLRAFD